jgi:hypothetical protein
MAMNFRFDDFLTQPAFLSLCTNFRRNRVVIAYFIACTWISNMAAAAILEVVGHFRFRIFDCDGKSQTYLSISLESDENWLSYYSLNVVVMAAAAILDCTIGDDRWPLT